MKVKEISIADIQIPADRQRTDLGNIQELHDSIAARSKTGRFQDGLINAIVVRKGVLVAGERRLRAHILAGVDTIFAADWGSLSPREAELIELEENTRRKELTWVEQAKAIQRIHAIQLETNPAWTGDATCEYLGYGPRTPTVLQALALEGLLTPALEKAPTLASAYQTISRTQTRALADISNELFAAKPAPLPQPIGDIKLEAKPQPKPKAPVQPVLNESFLDFAPQWTGAKFNLIHCDFPYGIDLGESDQMKADQNTLYDDSADVYWTLCKSLIDNLDRIMYPSGHIVFWFSMEHYVKTLQFFEAAGPATGLRIFPKPIIWHRSDGAGLVPDHRRRPRNTYETAFVLSRGDRFINKPVASSYGGPSAPKKLHPSEKPEPMLRHFFEMFVDEQTSILDPTAGSGSALRAAVSLGASRILGLEISAEFCGLANASLREAANKRELAERLL